MCIPIKESFSILYNKLGMMNMYVPAYLGVSKEMYEGEQFCTSWYMQRKATHSNTIFTYCEIP